MKALVLLGLVLMTGIAQANYECKSSDNAQIVQVQEILNTRLEQAVVSVTSGAETNEYFGTIHFENGILLDRGSLSLTRTIRVTL